MKKIDFGQAVGILANIGVIAGILLLATELNQNNELMRAQQRFNHLSVTTGTTNLIMENPDLAVALATLNPEFTDAFDEIGERASSLTPAQRLQVHMFGSRIIDNQYWSYTELPRADLPIETWRGMALADFWRIAWNQQSIGMDTEFVAFMEENVIQ